MNGSRRRAAAAALLLLLASSCAGGARPPATEPSPTGVSFVIENTESPGRGLSVTLEAADGDRMLLGAVGPRRTESFVEEGLRPTVSYRLVAGLTGGRDVVSERFTVSPGSTVRWSLPTNNVTVSP